MRFRFSGHETFPCRYTWLPKAYRSVLEDPKIFSDVNRAMVRLGVGKNMVSAIRFWMQAFGVVRASSNGFSPTSFGHGMFHERGFNPYLEDIRTLWLLHWNISTIKDEPLFAWHYLFNQWVEPDFSKTEIVRAFTVESDRLERPLSSVTKEQHFDVFLHTYLPPKSRNGNEVSEESLDCPLTELRLINPAGEKKIEETDRREPIYAFRKDFKTDVPGKLLAYCIYDFWKRYRQEEATLSFQELASEPNSIGHVFKMSEPDLRTRLESISKDSEGFFEYRSSAALPRLVAKGKLNEETKAMLLSNIYNQRAEAFYLVQPQQQLAIQA